MTEPSFAKRPSNLLAALERFCSAPGYAARSIIPAAGALRWRVSKHWGVFRY
jgi:hypothetical protein